jgi:endonuclease/exonuclease/phosphatase family metal-dependent hydrolase
VEICTWNVFHGNTNPPQRRSHVREAVETAAGYGDVVCLQELPAWALSRLAEWTPDTLAARPALGPFPSTAEVGRVLTSLDPGLLRSAFSGQGNAILLAPRLRVLDDEILELNARSFRRSQASWLGLGLVARLAWAKERRVCQAARIDDGTRTLLVANLHATSYKPDERLADAELLRAFAWVDGLAHPGEPVVVAGDFNVTRERSRTLRDVTSGEWGFSQPGPGIDHVLVRGLRVVSGPRKLEHTISDHAPVVVEVE